MTKEKRTSILMAMLLVILGAYIAYPYMEIQYRQYLQQKNIEPPLEGSNNIHAININRNKDGIYYAEISYFYTGAPQGLFIAAYTDGPTKETSRAVYENPPKAKRGENKLTLRLLFPFSKYDFTSSKVTASLGDYAKISASKSIDYKIEWHDTYTYQRNLEDSEKSINDLFKEVPPLIDQHSAESLALAKSYLERIILKDPSYVDAYHELARYTINANWNPEGLRQAQQLLNTAIKINPKHENSHILLAYVLSYERKFKEAEIELETAKSLDAKSLWLWSNWGDYFLLQEKVDPAIEKYTQAISSPRSYDRDDRARLYAYEKLLVLYEAKNNLPLMNKLLSQRASEYLTNPCYKAEYATFRIYKQADYAGALEDLKTAIDKGCTYDATKETLGVAYYMAWSVASEAEKERLLGQASVFLPQGPRLFFLLSRSEETSKILPGILNKSALSINQKDNNQLNALAYALFESDILASKKLLRYGANPDITIGKEQYPLALIPVFNKDIVGIKLMQDSGIDYAKINYKGINAIDLIKEFRNKNIDEQVLGKLKLRT